MKLPKKIRIPKFKKRTVITLVVLAILILFSTLPPVNALFISLFILFVSFRIDTKILGGVSIALLISIPILQHFERVEEAEQMAVYVYFLLVIIVLVHIIESRRVGAGEWIGNTADAEPKVKSVKAPVFLGSTLPVENAVSKTYSSSTGKSSNREPEPTFNSSKRRSAIPTNTERDTTHVDWFQVDEEEQQFKNRNESDLRVSNKHTPDTTFSTDENTRLRKREPYRLSTLDRQYVEPVWKRDERKEKYIPDHRLAKEEDYIQEVDELPLHLSLPERLKLLSEKQREGLHTTKPTLDGVKRGQSSRFLKP